jgi:hypothetical protein
MSETKSQRVDWTVRPLRLVLRTDGSVETLQQPIAMAAVLELIHADCLDVVSLHHLGKPLHVMVVDDNGWDYEVIDHGRGYTEHRTIRPRKPINLIATELYLANCKPNTTHQIAGDAVVVPDDDFAPLE